MPKFNKGDSVRVRLTSHSPYRGQTGIVDEDPVSYAPPSDDASGFWYMVRFEWKGLHPAARFMEEDLELPTEPLPEEIPVAAGPVQEPFRNLGDRLIRQTSLRKYYLVATVAVLVVVGIVIGMNIGGNNGPSNPSGFPSDSTQPPIITGEPSTNKLSFAMEFKETKAGQDFPIKPVVNIVDENGNIVTDSTAEVTLGVTGNRAILFGTTTVKAVDGVATFTDVNIRTAGSNYSLTAISPGMTSTIGGSFNVVPSPAIMLRFAEDPTSSGLQTNLTVKVTVVDLFWNTVTDSNAEVTISIAPDGGPEGAVLSGTTVQKARNGVATFSYVAFDPLDADYVLVATSPSLLSTTSRSFNPYEILLSASSESGS